MKIRILTKDVSHLLFSTLSHNKIEAGPLGGKMNHRLREEGLIQKEDLFYSFYGLSKKKGLVKLINSEFSITSASITSYSPSEIVYAFSIVPL